MRKLLKDRESSKDLYMIISNLNRLYKTGIPIVKAMNMLKSLPIKKSYRESVEEISSNLRNGLSFYDSFSNFGNLYSKFFLTLIKIGEETGELAEILYGLEIYYKSRTLIKKKVVGIIIYPIIILITLIITSVAMVRVVVPNIHNILVSMNGVIPKEIEFIMNINSFINRNPVAALIFIVSWGIMIPAILITYKKEFIINKLRKVKISKVINEFISIVLLKMIFKSGINLSTGVECCAQIANIYDVKHIFMIINNEVKRGSLISESMVVTGVFNEYTIAYIKIAEESGNISEVLEVLEKEMFNNIDTFFINSLQWIQPFMIALAGVIVMIFISKIILPIMNSLYGGSFV